MTYGRFFNTFDAGAQGTTITATNSAGSGTAFTAAFGSGVSTYDSSAAIQGARGMLTEAASSSAGFNITFAAPVAAGGVAVEFFAPSVPTADLHIARLLGDAQARLVSIHINGAGKLRLTDATSTTSTQWTATDALVAGTKYRLELYAKAGASTTTGEIRAAYFAAGSTVPIGQFASTAVNAGTGTPFAGINFGRLTASSIQLAFDSVVWETDGVGLPGPLSTPLATPVVTLGTKTNPTTTNGTDGKQVFSWAAVAEAGSYEAWLAPGLTPAPGSFVRVAQGITALSYEFTGLGAGPYTGAIRAKAAV